MADRDRYDWDRERGRDGDRNRGYGRGNEWDRDDDRGMVARGADEVRSWFGDDEARRRREMDERRDGSWDDRSRYADRDRAWGANSESARREHGWGGARDTARQWESSGHPSGPDYDRDWSERGYRGAASNAGPTYQAYGFGSANWTGAPRDTAGGRGPEFTERTYPHSPGGPQYTGGAGNAAWTQNPAFSGGYGAGSRESGNWRGDTSWHESGSTGEGRRIDQSGGLNYGRSEPRPGASYAGRGPRNYQRSDDRVREDVNERLTADPRVDASDIDVRVQNGEVTLTGTVDDRRTRRLAEEIIEDLPGVRDVRNDLRVNRSQGWTQQGSEQRPESNTTSGGRADGALGHTGDPQKRDDVTTLNQDRKINR